MDLFRKNAVFIGEADQNFHEEELFEGAANGETLLLVGRVSWTVSDKIQEGAIHISDSMLRLFSIEKDGEYSVYNFTGEFPIIGSEVTLHSDSQIRFQSSSSGIDWIVDVPGGAHTLYSATSAIFSDDALSLLKIWFDQLPIINDTYGFSSLIDIDSQNWSVLRKQIYLVLVQEARRIIPYMPFNSEFAFDMTEFRFRTPVASVPISTSCGQNPRLKLEYPLLRDRNGHVVPCEVWAMDLRMNPFRGLISPQIVKQNQSVIQTGRGEIHVHCPRCDYLNKNRVNTADQRAIIAEMNKRNQKIRKAQELQKEADRYRARGAMFSGQMNQAREIEAISAINSALTGRPRLFTESDVTSDFSMRCSNCGNIADEY